MNKKVKLALIILLILFILASICGGINQIYIHYNPSYSAFQKYVFTSDSLKAKFHAVPTISLIVNGTEDSNLGIAYYDCRLTSYTLSANISCSVDKTNQDWEVTQVVLSNLKIEHGK